MTINLPSIDTPPAGAIRFNSDSMKLEVYRGGIGIGTTGQTGGWWQIDNASVGIGTSATIPGTSGFTGGSGTRAVILAGQTPANRTDNQYINVASTGNSIDFGTLSTIDGGGNAPFSDRTRGIFSGNGAFSSSGIQFITISSTGNSTTFGTLTTTSGYAMGGANSTRGVRAGNFPANTDVIDYVTIQSTGDAKDFGDLTVGRCHGASNQSSTRGVFSGGYSHPTIGNSSNVIDFINFSTTGNAADFGDLTTGNRHNCGGNCNAVRGLIGGGNTPSAVNTIEYITTASTGNSTDFGDLTRTGTHVAGGSCSPTRGVFTGGYVTPAGVNIMDYVNIMSLGNAIDFGDISTAGRFNTYACSNGHGGL